MIAIEEAVSLWLSEIEAELSDTTWPYYRRVVRQWQSFAPARLADVTTQHINAWIESQLRGGLSPNTLRTYTQALKAFFRWAEDKWQIHNPMQRSRGKRIKQTPPKQRIISPEEYELLRFAISGMPHDLIVFLGNTGVRAKELMRITWHDIRGDRMYVLGKGNKPRLIDLNKTVRAMLNQYQHAGCKPKFIAKCASSQGTLRHTCWRAAERCRIPPFGPHALRHYYATELMRRGVPLKKISMALGHSSVAITEKVYIHATFEDISGINSVLDD